MTAIDDAFTASEAAYDEAADQAVVDATNTALPNPGLSTDLQAAAKRASM